MAAATPPVVSRRLGEQAAMEWSCILEVFVLFVFVPVLDLEAVGNGEYVMDKTRMQTIYLPGQGVLTATVTWPRGSDCNCEGTEGRWCWNARTASIQSTTPADSSSSRILAALPPARWCWHARSASIQSTAAADSSSSRV